MKANRIQSLSHRDDKKVLMYDVFKKSYRSEKSIINSNFNTDPS